MRIRIKKPPPAPLMDGFDVSRFQFGRTYRMDARLARYLIFAGYGEAAQDDRADEKPAPRRRKTRERP